MPWNLLILPLLGGFWLLRTCNLFRFRSQYLEGYRLLMESAIAGVLLTGLGRLITSLTVQVPWGRALEGFCHESLPFPFVGTTLSAFLLGLLVPFPINRWFKENQAKARAVDSRNDPLVSLLYKAADSLNPVTVTLDSRKVYEGRVNATEESDKTDANDFAIVIPLDHVTSVRFVGPAFDAKLFLKKSPPKADSAERPSGE